MHNHIQLHHTTGRRRAWTRLLILFTAVPLALALGCLPKEEENPYDGLLAKGCDPGSSDCSVTSTAGCFDPDPAFCEVFSERQDPWAAEQADPADYNQKALERAGFNYPGGEVCQTHYASSCGSCPKWTLESCGQIPVEAIVGEEVAFMRDEAQAPLSRQGVIERDNLTSTLTGRRGDANLCIDAFQRECTSLFNSQCPPPTDAICTEVFANRLPGRILPEAEENLPRFTNTTTQVADVCADWTLYNCVEQCRDEVPPEQINLERCENLETTEARSTCGWYERSQCNFKRQPLCEAAYPITLERCAARRTEGDYCADAITGACEVQLPALCQEAHPSSLDRCLDPTLVPEVCRPALAERCRLELKDLCQAAYPPTLDLCADLPGQTPASCAPALGGVCNTFVEAACPGRNAANCAYPDLAHPLCQARLETACEGWEMDLCDGDFSFEACADSTRFYELVNTLEPACAGPAISRCEDTLVAYAEAERLAENSCLGTIVFIPEAGNGPITTEDGYSVPGRFDCVAPNIGQATGVAATWEANGQRLSSCEEYGYQYFHTYNRFKNAVEPFKDDARLVYDVAYSNNPAYRDFAIGYRARNMAVPFFMINGVNINGSPAFGFLVGGADPYWEDTEPQYGLLPRRDYADEFSDSVPRSEFFYLYQVNFGLLELQAKLWHVGNTSLSSEERSAYSAMWSELDSNFDQGNFFDEYWPITDRVFTPDSGWEYHAQMGENLRDASSYLGRNVRDAELQHFYDRRQRYKEALDTLLAERQACFNEQRLLNPGTSPNAIRSRCELRLAPEINTAAAAIAQYTFEAWNNGCFEHYTHPQEFFNLPTPCDWAPADFVEELRREFEIAQSRLINGCQSLLGHTFDELRDGYTYLERSGPNVVQRTEIADATDAMASFDRYLQRRQTTQLLMPLYLAQLANLPPSEQPTWGQAWNRSAELGDRSWIAAGYQVGASWQVVPPPNNDVNRIAETNVKAEAYMEAYAFMFNDRLPIIDGQVRANAQERGFNANLRLFGFNVWGGQATLTGDVPDPGIDPLPNLAYDWSVTFAAQPEFSASESRRIPIISVVGISIFLEIGGAGRIGLEMNARAWFESSPQTNGAALHMGIQGLIRPYAAISGFAEAGFDLVLVEVGVGGSLELVMADLPVALNASVRAAAGQNLANAQVDVDTTADFNLNALRGDIYYFIDFGFFGGKKKKTIHREPGILRREELLKSTYNQSFGVLFNYCQQGLGVCAAPTLAPPQGVDGIAEGN